MHKILRVPEAIGRNMLHYMPLYYALQIRHRFRKKACQRVARPACANATVHFLLTYTLVMLLPLSEWPRKTSA